MTDRQIPKQQNIGFSFSDPAWTNVSCSKQWSDMGIWDWDGCHQRMERKEESAVSIRSVFSPPRTFLSKAQRPISIFSIFSDFLYSDWLIFDFYLFLNGKELNLAGQMSRRKKQGTDRGRHGWMDAWPHPPICDSYVCLIMLCIEMIRRGHRSF